jgi:hypothetical protein
MLVMAARKAMPMTVRITSKGITTATIRTWFMSNKNTIRVLIEPCHVSDDLDPDRAYLF